MTSLLAAKERDACFALATGDRVDRDGDRGVTSSLACPNDDRDLDSRGLSERRGFGPCGIYTEDLGVYQGR